MRSATRVSAACLLVVASACGDEMAAPSDAGVDGALPPDAAPEVVPDPPVAPASVDLTPCPAGWASVDVADTTTCEPWALADGPGCPPLEVRFPGDPSCAPLGSGCPADGIPLDLPAGPVVHVREGGSGDGTAASPFGSIAEALAASAPGGVVAVAVGTYREAVDLTDTGVSLVGACAAETVIDAPAGSMAEAGVVLSGGSHLERVTVRALRPGLRADGAGTASVRDVWVVGEGIGVVVTGGATLEADGLVVWGVAVRGEEGYGLFSNLGSSVTLRRAYFEGATAFGLAFDGATTVLLEDTVVREVAQTAAGGLGNGIVAQAGTALTLRRVLVERVAAAGVFVQSDSEAFLQDVSVRDVAAPAADGDSGFGVSVSGRAIAHLSRVHVSEASSAGIIAIGYQARVDARDVFVRETRPQASGARGGVGFYLDTGVTALVERIRTHHCRGAAIALTGADLDATFRDVTCDETLPDATTGTAGAGIDVRLSARGVFERVLISDSVGAGVVVSGAASEATVIDARVARSRPGAASGLGGRGASVQQGARLSCLRCAIVDSVEAGVLLHGGGHTTLRDVTIEDTALSESSGAGMGLVAVDGAVGDVERFVIRRNALAGVQIATGGDVWLRDGVIAENPIGVNVQNATPNTEQLSDGVVYRDNGQNLDSSGLPVPATPAL